MIVQLRLDERLIHGQITTAWSRALDIDTTLVANDHAAGNVLLRNTLMMARPADKKVAIKSITDTLHLLKDPRAEKMKILILVDNPKDALCLAEELNIHSINIANYLKKKSPDKIKIADYCSADKEDFILFEKLIEGNREVFSQMVPNSEKHDFKVLLHRAK